MTRTSLVCAVASQPGQSSVQLECGLRITDSPGIIFKDDGSTQGQKEPSVLLRNMVKLEQVDDPFSVGVLSLPAPVHNLISGLSPVEEDLARTQSKRLMKIYDLPKFFTLEFLTILALNTGCLLKVRLSPSFLP